MTEKEYEIVTNHIKIKNSLRIPINCIPGKAHDLNKPCESEITCNECGWILWDIQPNVMNPILPSKKLMYCKKCDKNFYINR